VKSKAGFGQPYRCPDPACGYFILKRPNAARVDVPFGLCPNCGKPIVKVQPPR
jgi:predicted RNA-binding Zn-ribbon protein involved in translation (DUF1610 family)